MARARAAIQEIFYEYMKAGMMRPVLLCHFNGQTLQCLNRAGEGEIRNLPAALASVGGLPTLATVLHLHSKVGGRMTNLEIPKNEENDLRCLVAVCGYKPTRADYGMAYRNGVRFVIEVSLNGESSCHKVTQSFDPSQRGELIQRDDIAGDRILGATWIDSRDECVVKFDDLVNHDWFNRFLTPMLPSGIKVPKYYEEDLTPEMQQVLGGSLSGRGTWQAHRAQPNTELWWVLVALYTSFAWSTQFPTYRSASHTDRRKANFPDNETEKSNDLRRTAQYGDFLDGLNVSGLLLDPKLTPVAWSFNSNRINKTLHAETALCLAWLKAHKSEKEFTGYTFLSPWRSCCMCSSWISDVFRGSKTIWFIDDPGLPVRHLDHGSNGATEVFLPSQLERGARASRELQAILDTCPWFQVMGAATHWDYNKSYKNTLNDMLDKRKDNPGPVDLFACTQYFQFLEAAWDVNRSLPSNVLQYLSSNGELKAYVNNIWALRRCVLTFDG